MNSLPALHLLLDVVAAQIAMGHPLGATGAMVLGTVLDELERQDKQTAPGRRLTSPWAWASPPSSSASERKGGRTS